jgi:hypothetical protein
MTVTQIPILFRVISRPRPISLDVTPAQGFWGKQVQTMWLLDFAPAGAYVTLSVAFTMTYTTSARFRRRARVALGDLNWVSAVEL